MTSDRKRDFTFRQLSSFVAAAREGSFALAAERLGISQPAISDHIAALEQHLGHSLFARRRGTTPTLTREGAELLHRAESMLTASQAMRAEAPRNGQEGKYRIRLSVGQRLREVYLKPLLARFYVDHPNIDVEIVPVVPIDEAKLALSKGKIDLLVYHGDPAPADLPNAREIGDVPIMILAAPALADQLARGQIALEDVPLILPDHGAGTDHWLERQLGAAGVLPRKAIRYVEYSDVVQSLAEKGVGATILMEEQVRAAIAAGRLVAIEPKLPAMKRIIATAPSAPRGTEILAARLTRVLRAGAAAD